MDRKQLEKKIGFTLDEILGENSVGILWEALRRAYSEGERQGMITMALPKKEVK